MPDDHDHFRTSSEESPKYRVLRRVLGEAWCEDPEKEVVKVSILCDNLIPTENKSLPENGKCDLKFFPDCQSFQVDLSLKDREKKTKTKWCYKMRKLPGRIVRKKSSWDVERGKIVVMLQKEDENFDWTPMVDAKGIDQLNSDESS